MLIKKQNSQNTITWFEFKALQKYPQIGHAIFSRVGGTSVGPYFGLNLGDTVGDHDACVQQNRRMAFSAASLPSTLINAHQVHGAYVHAVHTPTSERIANCDGLITNKSAIALGIQHADCQAAIFFDPINSAIACIHSGWKGNCLNIYKQTIKEMTLNYNTKVSDLIVCISPSLGPTRSEFIHYKKEFPEIFWRFGDQENYFNLWEIARWQLETEGVLPHNIAIAGHCTYTDAEHFYSYRRDKLCGRNMTCVWIKTVL